MGFSMCCFGSMTPDSRVKNDGQVCLEAISDDTKESPAVVKRYKWEEIEKYTMNFKEVIGIGGYSMVYLAKFPNSTLGAVKMYNNNSERLNQVFKSELEISQKLHHANIVKLLGYCDDNDGGVLVFEYIPKGNLQEELHNHQNNVKTKLTWKQRIKIAYQLAKALEYLHESCDLQIVHGDIKGSNILLDENLNCMLCDFGFAKMGFSSMIKPPSSSRLTMMGSPGYIDPHFLMTGIASKKSDVYSFGVILLELITGLEAFICSGENQILLSSVLRNKESFDVEKLVKMIDPRINQNENVDKEEVKIMGEIAARCLHHLPSLRPNSSEICIIMQEKISFVHDMLDVTEKSYGEEIKL
ncbi:putative receptor-like protein kinase At1g33260 [Silene latifolia]|uniref:putative receptor-like protein kinase At1g33260 n=1 Tax=Silene latifolia TaxID=37657 RepID=UPI003D76D232